LQTRPLNVKAVINPLRASGGADRDSRDQARRNAPLAVMALDRLVSVQDYADFARTFAGIGKASSARLSDGQRDLVHVTVAGANDIPIDHTSDLYANLVQALQVNGDLYLPIVVAVRQLKLLVISANVKIRPDYLWEPVATAVRTALVTAFSFDNRELGQPAFASEVISVIQGVAGVAYVDLDKFDSVAEGLTAAQLAGLANTIGLQDYVISSLALPNPRPVNPPADNIHAAELAYLTPAIPDTLILNQVKL
jgi:predicted phage baseplate assembly protein